MNARALIRVAVPSLMAAALTVSITPAYAATAPKGQPCARQQATVDRHTQTLTDIQQKLDMLEQDKAMADGEAEYAHINYYETRDYYRDLVDEGEDVTSPMMVDLKQQVDDATAAWQQAEDQYKTASQLYSAAVADAAPQQDKTSKLLARAQNALDACLGKQ